MTLKKLWGSFGRIYSCLQHDVLCRACFPSSHNALRFSAVHCHGAKNWQRYLFLWQIWLGASYAVKERKHLRIEAVQSMIKSASGKIRFELVALFLWLVFSIFMVYKGGELVKLLFIRGQVSPAMRVSYGVRLRVRTCRLPPYVSTADSGNHDYVLRNIHYQKEEQSNGHIGAFRFYDDFPRPFASDRHSARDVHRYRPRLHKLHTP